MINAILAELNIPKIINAGGTKTTVGGSYLEQEVVLAMAEMSQCFVDVKFLNKSIGKKIAAFAGAESGFISSGAASGQVLASAACLKKSNSSLSVRLEPTSVLTLSKREIIVQRIHYGDYAYNYGLTGSKIVEVGTVNKSSLRDIEQGINENTIAITHLLGPRISGIGPKLKDVCSLARSYNIPVIVDAAAMLPPKENLRRYIDDGADIVIFSGGKALRGPASTGIVLGKADLIDPIYDLASPEFGWGRCLKISKENLIGIFVAFKNFVEAASDSIQIRQLKLCEQIINKLNSDSRVRYRIAHDDTDFLLPSVVVTLAESNRSSEFLEIVTKTMMLGEPQVFTQFFKDKNYLVINPFNLKEHEIPLVISKFNTTLDSIEGILK